MHKQRPAPARNFLSASLSMALGLSLAAGVPGAGASGHDLQADGDAGPAHALLPTIIDPDRYSSRPERDRQLAADMNYDLSSSPIAHGLASGNLDLQAQRTLLEQLRAEDEPSAADATISATHIVTNCDNSGPGSLREAINQADEGDIIDMSNLACSTITLVNQLLIPQDDLTLRGKLVAGDKYLPSPVIAGHKDNEMGLLSHGGEGTLRLEALGLKDGTKYSALASASGGACISSSGNVSLTETAVKYCTTKVDQKVEGGAIRAAGDVTLTRSQVIGSAAVSTTNLAYGGGIYAGGRLKMTDSVLRDNTASADGNGKGYAGGAFARGGGTLRRVDIQGNVADVVGGVTISANSGPGADIYIKHALVRDNSSIDTGLSGGMYLSSNGSKIDLYNNTFTNNTTAIDTGAGVRIHLGSLTMVSNLISGNWWVEGSNELVADYWSNVPAAGSHNLVGWVEGPHSPPADTIWQLESPLINSRPDTGSWAFNRGTFTHDVIGFTPAPPGCVPNPPFQMCLPTPVLEPAIDQSGNNRTVGAGTDIGALESDALLVDGFNRPPTIQP